MGPKEIKQVREAMGLTQAEFATRLGVTASALESWEQGRRRPSEEATVKLLQLVQHHKAAKEA